MCVSQYDVNMSISNYNSSQDYLKLASTWK